MAVNLHVPSNDQLAAVPGCKIGVTQAGIRKANRRDLTLFEFAPGTTVAGVFTKNRFCAAPVQVCKEHLAHSANIRGLVINTGCANAGTGEPGLAAARQMAQGAAKVLGVTEHEILPFSTGVILELLPVDRVLAGLPGAHAALATNNWLEAAHGIMTTDTLPKATSQSVQIDGQTIVVTGISKGAGMIKPNMATMLGFVATNAKVSASVLQAMVTKVANASFNRITIDGDTSTNDSFVIAATGQTQLAEIQSIDSAQGQALLALLTEVSRDLAQKIVRDGEGATKFITLNIEQAANQEEALKVAYAIAHSPLVKTAFFASDPNLGRILAAVGYAGVEDLDQTKISMWIEGTKVVTNGGRDPSYQEQDGQAAMKKAEITVRVALGRGQAADTVYTCDLSHEYVSINADYRS